jgi:hypothetical protein
MNTRATCRALARSAMPQQSSSHGRRLSGQTPNQPNIVPSRGEWLNARWQSDRDVPAHTWARLGAPARSETRLTSVGLGSALSPVPHLRRHMHVIETVKRRRQPNARPSGRSGSMTDRRPAAAPLPQYRASLLPVIGREPLTILEFRALRRIVAWGLVRGPRTAWPLGASSA